MYREGLSCLQLPWLRTERICNSVYLSGLLGSIGPILLHDLVDVGTGPSVSPKATSLHGWNVSDQAPLGHEHDYDQWCHFGCRVPM